MRYVQQAPVTIDLALNIGLEGNRYANAPRDTLHHVVAHEIGAACARTDRVRLRAHTLIGVQFVAAEETNQTSEDTLAITCRLDLVDTKPFNAAQRRACVADMVSKLSTALTQEAIAWRGVTDLGERFEGVDGPRAEKWGAFNADYFIEGGAIPAGEPDARVKIAYAS